MDTSQAAEKIISSALQLPPDQREAIADALLVSIPLENIDHGPQEPDDQVKAAWEPEIARRIEEVDSGQVQTIPAEDVWDSIKKGKRPEA